MNPTEYSIEAEVWLYPGKAGWHFITVPQATSQAIRDAFEGMSRGWGSLPVSVRLHEATWETSIFPDKTADAYLLPLKAEVRKRTGVQAGDIIQLTLTVRV